MKHYKLSIKDVLLIILGYISALVAAIPVCYNAKIESGKLGMNRGIDIGCAKVMQAIRDKVSSVEQKLVNPNQIIDFGNSGSLAFIEDNGSIKVVPLK